MTHTNKRTTKILSGIACIIAALLFPAAISLLLATNGGFGRTSSEQRFKDMCLAAPFALCAIALAWTGIFLIAQRSAVISNKARAFVVIGVLVGIVPAASAITYLRATSMTGQEACRRNVQQFDAAIRQWNATNDVSSGGR